jgi:histidinol dehydrogenase
MNLVNKTNPLVKILSSLENGFDDKLNRLLSFDPQQSKILSDQVEKIIDTIKKNGDEALIEYSSKFDNYSVSSVEELEVSKKTLKDAYRSISFAERSALNTAADRIYKYHEHQELKPYSYIDEYGSEISMRIFPIEKVGIYVPGGTAAYPSSVLMNAIPARVANVKEIVMVVPSPAGVLNPMVLAAAHLAGVSRVFKIGGAHAIAALAFGTKQIPKVDKIVGPGNSYVAEAKKQVYGVVGIDMVAGPSEILVICDGKTNPDWVALDLFSQAEHDESAQAILLTTDKDFLEKVYTSIENLLPKMERRSVIETSLNNRGALILVDNLTKACELSNRIAPEHLELSVENSKSWSKLITNAGSLFLGRYSSEALGDYCAGPNHVLPTSGSARFSSGLSVYDFKKRISVISVSEKGADVLGGVASTLANGEKLSAHALAAEYRMKNHLSGKI